MTGTKFFGWLVVILALAPLLVIMVIVGVFPSVIVNLINSSVTLLLGKL